MCIILCNVITSTFFKRYKNYFSNYFSQSSCFSLHIENQRLYKRKKTHMNTYFLYNYIYLYLIKY